MADRRVSLRSSVSPDLTQVAHISEVINTHKEFLTYCNDGKVLWLRNFEDLKKFVYDMVGDEGKWSTPGGNS